MGGFRAKILVAGPAKAGKTAISNFLGDLTESLSKDYEPTKGVRIVEFERSIQPGKGKGGGSGKAAVKTEIELWDLSGDWERWNRHYPSFAKDALGVVLVLPNEEAAAITSLENWIQLFKDRVPEEQFLIYALQHEGENLKSLVKAIPKAFAKIPVHLVGMKENTVVDERAKEEFDKLLTKAHALFLERRELEEQRLMT